MKRPRLILGIVIAIAAFALAWVLMSTLARVLRTAAPPEESPTPAQQAAAPGAPAVPHIKATLFFGSEDGQGLVAVEQDIPLAEGVVAQGRALIEAQLAATPPAPLVATIPQGTRLRGLYVSERNEAFVDLDSTVRTKHPGGSMHELFTVYTIVNAVTTNIANVEQVQLLVDGREVDTLAGHVDLRRPLRKNEALIKTAVPTP